MKYIFKFGGFVGLLSIIMSQLISAIRAPSSAQPAKAAIIFLHGLGDTGEGWSWFPQLAKQQQIIKSQHSINYVFPNAPQIPITVNGGYVMPGWFDIYEFGNPNAKQDIAGFLKSCDLLKQLIKEQIEVHQIKPERILIGGFSQGAAISLATASLLDFKIGGVIALSGFCPVKDTIKQSYNKDGINFETPFFQGHGTADPVIAYQYGRETSEFYQSVGFTNYQFNTYAGVAHSADERELTDVQDFINKVLES